MQRKTVIFIADSLDNAHKFQQVLSKLDVDVAAGSSVQFKKLLAAHPSHDLIIYEARGDALGTVATVEAVLAEEGATSMLVIVNEDQLAQFRLPVSCKADFVVHGASAAECATRIRQLLWPGNEGSSADYITVENMTVNLATYQVKVGDVIEIKEKNKDSQRYKDILEVTAGRLVPEWLTSDAENLQVTVKEMPTRAAIDVPVNEMLIVELYSK